MSKNRKKIVEAIQNISAPAEDAIMSGYVKEVDEAKATMSVVLNISGQIIEGVLLHAVGGSLKGMVVIPEQDSDVVICSVDGSGEYMLVQADKIKKVIWDIGTEIDIRCDKIVFNGGVGTVPVTSRVVNRLNNIENKLNDLLSKFLDHVHVSAQSGSPTTNVQSLILGPNQILPPALQNLQTTTDEDIEDSKILH